MAFTTRRTDHTTSNSQTRPVAFVDIATHILYKSMPHSSSHWHVSIYLGTPTYTALNLDLSLSLHFITSWYCILYSASSLHCALLWKQSILFFTRARIFFLPFISLVPIPSVYQVYGLSVDPFSFTSMAFFPLLSNAKNPSPCLFSALEVVYYSWT